MRFYPKMENVLTLNNSKRKLAKSIVILIECNYFTHLLATGSAEELPPRIRANPRGYARIRADTRGLRPVPRGSAGRPPKIFFGGLRRTSGERSADTGGLRADTGGSARSPR